MMRNNLFIQKLYVLTKTGEVAYDEIFHKGVNIIRGTNSSGKSTLSHFMFYVLGGAFNDFVPEARKCSVVIAEVKMNNLTFTIKRYIEEDDENNINPKAAMYFYWGTFQHSQSLPEGTNWQKFGYNTIKNSKSFSNVLSESMGLPIVKGDNNITFHQVLRLLYIDQESPTNSLFNYEHFDSQLTRETVSELLMGIYNEELYEKKKRLNVAEKELTSAKSELKATKRFFPDAFTLNPKFINEAIINKEKEIFTIEEEISLLRQSKTDVVYVETSKLNFQLLKEDSIRQRKIVSNLRDDISELKMEVEDTQFFISSLSDKRRAIENSINTREFLGHFPLDFCPECLSSIKKVEEGEQKCKLCKEDVDDSFGVIQAKRMGMEVGFQIQESAKILQVNIATQRELNSKFIAEEVKLHQIQRQVNSALQDVKSVNLEKIDSLLSDKGYAEGEISQYKTMLEKAVMYESLIKLKNDLANEIDGIKGFVYKTELNQAKLKKTITEKIQEEGLYLLNNDLHRQDEFKYASEFTIDFSNNLAFLSNQHHKYSASSNFYLKVTARFAFFLASLSVDGMRFPRFIIADNMEDKGIELARAQNLQKILIERATELAGDDFQLIYTTSYISEELESSSYVVGDAYTQTNPSLKHIPTD